MTLEAVIFGGMGSLAECAELDRAAWNAAFRMHDVPWDWSWDTYCELMRPGGDRQLAARYAAHLGEVLEAEALDATHQRLFAAMLAEEVPLRPGVARVLAWAARGGVKLAIVSRAELQPVSALLRATARARAGISFDVAVLRSDVTHMAPDPEAMLLAVEKLGVGPGRSVVVADTPVAAEARGARACRCWPSPDGWPRRSRSCSRACRWPMRWRPRLTRAWRDGLITAAAE
jgi:beta-phosphoglucomutase-like phosphatase (HAD superfamily)